MWSVWLPAQALPKGGTDLVELTKLLQFIGVTFS